MKLYGLKKIVGEGLITVTVVLGVGVIGQTTADASKYADGNITVGVKVLKKDSDEASISQQFFEQTASGTMTNDVATLNMKFANNGGQYLSDTKVNGQEAMSADHSSLNYSVPADTAKARADFAISAGPVQMNQSADFAFDWSGVPLATATGTDTGTSTGTDTGTSTGTDTGTNTGTGTGTNTGTDTNTGADSTNTSTDTNTNTGSGTTDTTTPVQSDSKINYNVLQADGSSSSEANQYYTHIADIQQQSDGTYKVTMYVTYTSALMGQKDFIPLTVNGTNVSDVQYGVSGSNYTNSFSFVVPSIKALTSGLLNGTIHVNVPSFKISSDFTVNYAFDATSMTNPSLGGSTTGINGSDSQNNTAAGSISNNAAQTATTNTTTSKATTTNSSQSSQTNAKAKQSAASAKNATKSGSHATANGVYGNGSTTGVDANGNTVTGLSANGTQSANGNTSAKTLPQTSEQNEVSAAIVGMVSLLLVLGTVILKKKES